MPAPVKSVESSCTTGIQAHNKTAHRKFEREAKPLGKADQHQDMMPLATAAARRIQANRHDRQVGSWLFGDIEGRVYVLHEQSLCASRMLKDHAEWMVGFYAGTQRNGKRPTCPKAVDVFGDLRQHFVDLGMVSEADLYAAIRWVEG